jgi:hypothetical protein
MTAEWLGAVILGNIFEELLPDIYQNRGFECSATILRSAPQSPLPVGGGQVRYAEPSRKGGRPLQGFSMETARGGTASLIPSRR